MLHHRFILDDQIPPTQRNSKETILLFLTINARLSSALQVDSAVRAKQGGLRLEQSLYNPLIFSANPEA